jgi:hypothetical protein
MPGMWWGRVQPGDLKNGFVFFLLKTRTPFHQCINRASHISEKTGSAAENLKKERVVSLRIPEKDRLSC